MLQQKENILLVQMKIVKRYISLITKQTQQLILHNRIIRHIYRKEQITTDLKLISKKRHLQNYLFIVLKLNISCKITPFIFKIYLKIRWYIYMIVQVKWLI